MIQKKIGRKSSKDGGWMAWPADASKNGICEGESTRRRIGGLAGGKVSDSANKGRKRGCQHQKILFAS